MDLFGPCGGGGVSVCVRECVCVCGCETAVKRII